MIDERVGVGELHPRIAEHNDKAPLRQCLLYEIEQDAAILAARERNVKAIEPRTILLIDGDDLLHRRLLDKRENRAILRCHRREIYGAEHRSLGQERHTVLARAELDLRCGIDIAALQLCRQNPTVVVAVRLCPEIRRVVLPLVLPVRIESEQIQLGGIYGARLLRKARRRGVQQNPARLAVIRIGINLSPSLSRQCDNRVQLFINRHFPHVAVVTEILSDRRAVHRYIGM